jgi:histone-lysine N-methyltransferase SETDB1
MVNTGIFECNPNCKCDHRCSNRVVQNGISLRLQLFKTNNKGWGLRCLDDIPKGTFVCTYAGDILTESQSDIRGKELGDEYFAELDFVECLRKLRNGRNSSDEEEEEEEEPGEDLFE